MVEAFPELLPRYLLPDLFKIIRDLSFVLGVEIACKMLSFAFDDDDLGTRAFIFSALHNEVRKDATLAEALDGKVFLPHHIAVPPEHFRVFIEIQRHLSL